MILLIAFTALTAFASPTMAQEESAPSQASEETIGDPAQEAPEEPPKIEPPEVPADDSEDMVNLNLNKQDVSEIIEFIVRWTGKVVMVQEQALLTKKITVMSEKKLPKDVALEILYQAFKMNDIAVVETEDMIMIDNLNDVSALQPGVVLGPEVDVESMNDDGNIVIKVFQITEAKAQNIYDRLEPSKPEYARLTVDANSNQIIVESDLGYAKRVGRLIKILDVEPYLSVKVETFRLRYADATTIADLIETLFASSGTASAPRVNNNQNTRGRTTTQQRAQAPTVEVGTSEQLTVTVLEPTNSITVRAEPDIITEIGLLLTTAWDVAPAKEGDIFRIYDLKYTDPLKVKELLAALLESGGGGSAGAARGQQRTNNRAATTSADAAVANIFRIEAYPDSNRLIVISKSPSNFEWLNTMIDRIDQPLSVGMPVNIELKHASAIDLAEILNSLLAAGGSSSSISAPDEGLTGVDFSVGSSDGNSTGTTGDSGGSNREISFPWQSQRDTDSTEVSALVGKARVVPNASQNSLLVLATPEIQDAVLAIIEDLDRPGRQVMITAVLAEVELGDQFEFGLRFGQGITTGQPDNALVINTGFVGDKTDFVSGLSSSVLGVEFDATMILQALDQVTNTRILQQPRIFTTDNAEAKFFDGQDVPFQSGSTVVAGQQTIDYEQIAVGIGVNVRPRITKEKNVAMEIEILLSNVNTNSPLGAGGNPVIDRRQTNTTVTVKNGQTIVISGIRQETEGRKQRKVPILGDIPFLDLFFSSESEDTIVSELVVFVTPIVVDNPDDNDVNFNEIDRRRLEQLSDPMGQRSRILQKKLNGNFKKDPLKPSDPRRD
jgi:type II secretory pathway component GspD/PulD (secretin)